MAKYEKLGLFLNSQELSEIPMTFMEVERVIGQPLPRSARYPAWWSNNPSNNVMTKIWLAAGFKTEQVDVVGRKLVFRRMREHSMNQQPQSMPQSSGMADAGRAYAAPEKPAAARIEHPIHPAFGSMKGSITLAPGVDLTKPAADPKSWKFRG